MSNTIHVLALTATATTETFSVVCSKLSMIDPVVVAVSPHRENIVFRVSPKVEEEKFVDSLCQEFMGEGSRLPQDCSLRKATCQVFEPVYAPKEQTWQPLHFPSRIPMSLQVQAD